MWRLRQPWNYKTDENKCFPGKLFRTEKPVLCQYYLPELRRSAGGARHGHPPTGPFSFLLIKFNLDSIIREISASPSEMKSWFEFRSFIIDDYSLRNWYSLQVTRPSSDEIGELPSHSLVSVSCTSSSSSRPSSPPRDRCRSRNSLLLTILQSSHLFHFRKSLSIAKHWKFKFETNAEFLTEKKMKYFNISLLWKLIPITVSEVF